MTTVQTRVREISDLEGFDIVVTRDGAAVATTINGVLGRYPYERKSKHTMTVHEWRRDRFEAAYPGFSCDVLNGDGSHAAAQATIRTVRETYEED